MTRTTKNLLGAFFTSIAAFMLGACQTDHLGGMDAGDIEIKKLEETQEQARQEPQSPTSGAGQQANPGSCALKCGNRCEVVAVSEKLAETRHDYVERFLLEDEETGAPLPGTFYYIEIVGEDAITITGQTDEKGHTCWGALREKAGIAFYWGREAHRRARQKGFVNDP